jgi:ABC-type lipoprotein release transport system permease subunit
VVGDVRHRLDQDELPLVYGLAQEGRRALNVVVRHRDRRDAARLELRAAVREVAPALPVSVQRWTEQIGTLTAYRTPRFQTLVLGTLAFLALTVTGLGVFGVVAYLVASRTQELGLRLAVGASPRALVRLVLGQSLWPVFIGLAVGTVALQGASRFAEVQLHEVDPYDPWTVALAAATVIGAALLAGYLPARRAASVDPAVALRAE